MALRATAELPFTFTEWFGTWVASGLDSLSQQDDVSTTAGWGGTTHDCGGHVLFGTDLDTSKKGGLWGWQWNYRGGMQRWTWSRVEVHETDVIRWEVLDQGPNEDVVFERIDVWVR